LFKVNAVLFTFDALAGGIIALWKSLVITVKVEIGVAATQIELREVVDKRRLYSVAIAVFEIRTHTSFMAQGAGVGEREGRRGADTAGDDEFGTIQSPTGAGEEQGLSPPVVRALDASLHAAQLLR
jgi:hypothetical protein